MIEVKKLILTEHIALYEPSDGSLDYSIKQLYWVKKISHHYGDGFQLWRKGNDWSWV